jgi:hypothetical protein
MCILLYGMLFKSVKKSYKNTKKLENSNLKRLEFKIEIFN